MLEKESTLLYEDKQFTLTIEFLGSGFYWKLVQRFCEPESSSFRDIVFEPNATPELIFPSKEECIADYILWEKQTRGDRILSSAPSIFNFLAKVEVRSQFDVRERKFIEHTSNSLIVTASRIAESADQLQEWANPYKLPGEIVEDGRALILLEQIMEANKSLTHDINALKKVINGDKNEQN